MKKLENPIIYCARDYREGTENLKNHQDNLVAKALSRFRRSGNENGIKALTIVGDGAEQIEVERGLKFGTFERLMREGGATLLVVVRMSAQDHANKGQQPFDLIVYNFDTRMSVIPRIDRVATSHFVQWGQSQISPITRHMSSTEVLDALLNECDKTIALNS